MKKNGFTLIELLGVIVILAIIMVIAVPNITSVLDKNKRETYIADAKKFVSLVQYKISNGEIEKPNDTELIKVSLKTVSNEDIEKDPNGDLYDEVSSFVVIARIEGYLEYFVHLKSETGKGIPIITTDEYGERLTNIDVLSGDTRLSYIETSVETPSDNQIKTLFSEKYNINANIINK